MYSGETKIVELLIKNGANITIMDEAGKTAEQLAASKGSPILWYEKLLIEIDWNSNGIQWINQFALSGNEEIVQLIAKHKANA